MAEKTNGERPQKGAWMDVQRKASAVRVLLPKQRIVPHKSTAKNSENTRSGSKNLVNSLVDSFDRLANRPRNDTER